jgi:hypothetical protein
MPAHHARPSTWLAIAVIGVILTVAIFLIAIPDTGRRHGSHHGPCDKCGYQMRGLAVGLQLWADNNNGELPDPDHWIDLFNEYGYAPREMFTSPNDPVPGHISYIYAPAESIDLTGKRVLLYEPLDLHPECGVHIALHDGHVELYPADEAQRIIEALILPDDPP